MTPQRGTWADRPAAPLTDPSGQPVTVVHLAAEYVPYARTGGLAEAVNGLARFQTYVGLPVVVLMPLYRVARDTAGDLEAVGEPFPVTVSDHVSYAQLYRVARAASRVQVYFIEHEGYFGRGGLYGEQGRDYPDNDERYAFFAMASLLALPRIVTGPVLLHAHDWHAALAFPYLRSRFAGRPEYDSIRTVLSLHNAGYQGHLPPSAMERLGLPWALYNWRQLEWYGQVNVLKGGLVFADAAVTVSPNHARELRTADGGFGLHEVFAGMGSRFSGIINGIDTRKWQPAHDPHILAAFDVVDPAGKAECKRAAQRAFGLREDPSVPLAGMAARLVTQKGLDLILGAPSLLDLDMQFVFLGHGEPRYEHALRAAAAAHPGRIAVETGFTDPLEHQLMAGADLCLMPCQYEPCGLTQMRAQRYGALPLVRRVGGLADTVDDEVTGFVFDAYSSEALLGAGLRALDAWHRPSDWKQMRRTAMTRDFSWERSVEEYLSVYRRVLDGTDRATGSEA